MNQIHNKFFLFSALLLTLSLSNGLVQAQPSNQEPRHIQSLDEKAGIKKKEQDLRIFLQNNPQVPEAHLNLGNAYWAEGRDGKPIRHYLAAIKLNPNYAEAYYNLGNVLFTQGEHEQAVQSYKKAIELKPSFAPAYNGLANAYIDEKKYGDAIETYKKALDADSSYKDAYHNVCSAYIYAARYYEGVSACRKAVNVAPDARSYNNLGNAYFRTKQFGPAIEAYNKALELNSDLPEAHFNLAAISLVHTKNKQEALNRQRILQSIDPQKGHKLTALIKASGI